MSTTSRMTRIAPSPHGRKPRTPARWSIEASRHVGFQPMTCEKRVQQGIHEEVGYYVAAALEFGAADVAAKLAQPVLLALDSSPVLPVDEAMRKAQRADALEEMAETAYLTNPTTENKAALILAVRAQAATSLQMAKALEMAR